MVWSNKLMKAFFLNCLFSQIRYEISILSVHFQVSNYNSNDGHLHELARLLAILNGFNVIISKSIEKCTENIVSLQNINEIYN